MTEVAEADPGSGAKRWLGYTCPECYAIFRVPLETQGKVASCPHCELPVVLGRRGQLGETELVPEEAPAANQSEDGWERSERSGRMKKRKRVQKKRGPKSPKWEGSGDESGEREGPLFFLVVLVGLLFLTAGVGVFLKRVMESRVDEVHIGDLPEIVIEGMNMNDEKGLVILPEDLNIEAALAEVTTVVTDFLTAGDVEELLKHVRDRPRVEKPLRSYYSDRLFSPTRFRGIASSGGLQLKDAMVSVVVELEDFSKRSIALERTRNGYLVDWESWVAWGELSWDEFQTTRPTRPLLMRVNVSDVDYYNFEFSDDREWKSYQLRNVTGDRAVYGYVVADSLVASQLVPPSKENGARSMILRLRYLKKATRRDQVIIEEVISHGWIMPKAKKPPTP